MNLFKKVIATIAIATTIVTTTAVSGVSAYDSTAADAAAKLAAQGVIVDHSDNVAKYQLDNLVKRQEVAAMAFSIAKLTKATTCKNEYSDVSATKPNTWACYVVEPLRDAGYLAKNKMFRPEANITKAEALGMMVSAAFGKDYKYDATKGTSWQEQLVDFAVNNGILKSAFTDYNTAATRGDVFGWTVNSIDAAAADMTDLGLGDLLNVGDTTTTDTTTSTSTGNTNTTTTTPVATTSNLTVTANPETPAGADLPEGADGVLVMKLDLTAGNQDTSVTGLNFLRTGFGQAAADKVSLFANGVRLTKSKTFNSDDEANVSVNPALVIKAGETVTVDVRIDTKTSVATDSDFAIKLTGVTASTDVDASEITSNTFTVKTVAATELDFQTGSVNSKVTAGETNAEVAEFNLKNAGNVNNSDITVKSITLKENGTIDQNTDLANFSLVNNGKVIATVASIPGKYLTFDLATPIVIKEGNRETFTVTADITGGAAKTINFVLDTEGDIIATASKYTAVNVVDEFTAGQTVNVQAGELTLYSIDAEQDKIRDNTDNVVLGTLKVVNVAGQDLNIKNFGINLTTTNSGVLSDLENVKVEINGTSYDLYANTTSTWVKDVTFSDTDLDITLPQGTSMLTVKADTLDHLSDGETITMKLNASSDTQFYVEETQDDNKVTDVTPSSLTWNDVEIKQPLATVSETPLADVAVVKGTSDIVALQFDVEANEVSPLTISQVDAKLSYAGGYGTAIRDYVTAVTLYKNSVSDANKLDSVSGTQIASDGTVSFDGFQTEVAANGTDTFIVTIDTADSDAAVNGEITSKLNYIDVEDDNNDTVTTDPVALSTIEGKTVTVKDSGKLYFNLATSAANTDNQNDKTILAGTEQTVFSIDTKATNEEINLERIKFDVTATGQADDLKDSIKEAKLYLGDNLVATTTNARVSKIDDNTVEVYFKDMTNTIVPTTSNELRLGLVTENTGYEKVGKTISNAKVTAIKLDENYVKWVESNVKVDINDDGTVDTATENTSTLSKQFAVVPMVVTPSVTDKFGTDDLNATVTIATDAGDNTNTTDGSSLAAKLNSVKLQVSSVTATGTLTLFNGNGDQIGTADVASDSTGVTINVTATPEFISNGEAYRIETTAKASFRLAKDGINYTVDSNAYDTNLDNTQDMGSYSTSN